MRRILVALATVSFFACPPGEITMDAGATGGGEATGGGTVGGGNAGGGAAGGDAGGTAGGATAGGATAGGATAGGATAGGATAGGATAGGATAGGATAGGSTAGGATAGGSTAGGTAGPVLVRSNNSTTIQISDDDSVVAMVNPDVNTVSFFNAATFTKSGSASFGADTQPEGVAIHPDRTTAFVLLRRSQQLAKVTAINTTTPQVAATRATTGSEPTGVALTPTGLYAVVANFGESTVSIINTSTMAVANTIPVASPPRAVAITNDGDQDDLDERVFVTLFYGDAIAEASDTGRIGKVVEISMQTRQVVRTIDLQPFADTGFSTTQLADGGFQQPGVGCSVNQLYGITIHLGKAYVPSVCASPRGPVNKFTNVFAAVSVIDLTTNVEDRGPLGSAVIGKLAQEQGGATTNLLGLPVAIQFAPNLPVGYLLSQAGDTVQRMLFDSASSSIKLGLNAAFAQISVRGAGGIKVPTGLILGHANGRLYVNNWVDRSLTVINLAAQAVESTGDGVVSEAKPTSGSTEASVLNGKKFFFTGTGRWADRSVNSCGSCHPDGLTDNLTWVFAAGPRQTTALDGSYGKRTPGDQRVFNWTAIFDEMHDFELNTRGTAGGKGAITTGTVPNDVAFNLGNGVQLPGFTQVTRNDFLSGSTKSVVASTTVTAGLRDWDDIEEYAKTIRANRAPTSGNATAIAAGRTFFVNNNCHVCHGGQKWTASRVPYTPSPDKNGSLPGANGTPATASGLRTLTLDAGVVFGRPDDQLKVDIERGVNLPDGGVGNVGPERITCAIRNVGTFELTSAVERKADGTAAQGGKGFNPPALMSIATGAPFFHHGAAKTLEEVFTARFSGHYTAASANLWPAGPTTQQDLTDRDNLIAFLKSIDDSTAPETLPAAQNLCIGY